MNQGHSAAWDQDWDKAADYYSAALEQFPNNAQALTSLGLALFELKDYPSSLQYYQQAAKLSPEDPIPHEKIARIYERLGQLNEAVAASLKAAEMHLKARSVDKAIDNWNHVVSLQPENISVRSRLAAVYEKIGRREEAVAEYISVASIFQRNGDLTNAIKVVEHALQVMPDNQEVRLALSMVRGNQLLPRPSRPKGGTAPVRMAQAHEMGEEAGKEHSPDPVQETRQRAVVQLAGLLFEQASEDTTPIPSRGRGINALTRGLADMVGDSSDRTRIILHLSQAIDSLSQGEDAQTVVELEHALNLGLRQPAGYYLLGMLIKDNSPEKSLKYLQQSVKHPDYTMGSNLLLGQIYEHNGQWHEAAAAYLQALSLADAQTVSANCVDDLISQYDALIDSQSSVEDITILQSTCKAIVSQLWRNDWLAYLKKARKELPPQMEGLPPAPVAEMVLETRNSQVIESMAHVRQLAAGGMLRSAIEEAMFALQSAPTYLPLHILIGELLLQEGHTSEGVQKFLVVADLYNVRGETGRAARLLKRISQIMPMDLMVRQRVIDLLIAQGKTEEAMAEYNDLAELYYSLADLDKARLVYLDALKVAQKSKENRTWGVNILLKVADIDMQRLNLRQALRIYEQIRTIQPDMAAVRAQIISLNFRLGQDEAAIKELDSYLTFLEGANRRPDAIDFVNDLLVDYPNRPELRRRLADLYIRSSQVDQAVAQLDSAADFLLTSGRHMEAVNMLETIISLNPANVQDYRTALETVRRDMLRR